MNERKCFLYPGQGAQYPGMAKDFWNSSDKVKELFDKASQASGIDLLELVFNSNEEELKKTDKQQPALTLANCATTVYLAENSIESDACVGFSLGEYSALWDAGVLSTEDVFKIVTIRGRVMSDAARNLEKNGEKTGMAAVLGLSPEEVGEVVNQLKEKDVFLANYNSPVQSVISGKLEGLKEAEELLEEAGAMKYIYLKVSGPFHTPIMEEARAYFEEELRTFNFNDPIKHVYSNATGKEIKSGEEAKELSIKQLVSPVLWIKEEETIFNAGYDEYLETGPGTVLSGLWKSFTKKVKCRPLGTSKAVDEYLARV